MSVNKKLQQNCTGVWRERYCNKLQQRSCRKCDSLRVMNLDVRSQLRQINNFCGLEVFDIATTAPHRHADYEGFDILTRFSHILSRLPNIARTDR